MTVHVRAAAVSAPFGRDLDAAFVRLGALVATARDRGVGLLVLPEATLGGYLGRLHDDPGDRPPALRRDGPELARLSAMAGDMVVCVGLTEADGGEVYNAAACVSGDGVLGWHRKVHQPLAEGASYAPGSRFTAFDTPAGRLGMMICYDKAFPESGRTLALQGAEIVACLSAWPMSRTAPAATPDEDRQAGMFDLYDAAGAAHNQLYWASANQCGRFGDLRFLGRSRVCDPAGAAIAQVGSAEGMAVADLWPDAALAGARAGLDHLRDLRPGSYQLGATLSA